MIDEIEVACEECGSVARFDATTAGTTQSCPNCRGAVDVPTETDQWLARHEEGPEAAGDDEGSIVLICPFCDEQARFDTSAAGTTQTCPNCEEEIDVLGSLVDDHAAYDAVYFKCDWCGGVATTNEQGLADGCECPHCHEANDAEEIEKNRLTTGQVERLGLLPEPETDN
jgi:hypothetical protein